MPDNLIASVLHVPDRVLECAYCGGVVDLFGERRMNHDDGKAHKCPGYLNAKRRGRL